MTRIELETILSKKGLKLQKVGNLYQVRSKALKTICQSHSIGEIARQILSGRLLYAGWRILPQYNRQSLYDRFWEGYNETLKCLLYSHDYIL